MYGMFDSYRSWKYYQKLIDEWNDPKDVMTRAAAIMRDIHGLYGVLLLEILEVGKKK